MRFHYVEEWLSHAPILPALATSEVKRLRDEFSSAQKFYMGPIEALDAIAKPKEIPRLPYPLVAFETSIYGMPHFILAREIGTNTVMEVFLLMERAPLLRVLVLGDVIFDRIEQSFEALVNEHTWQQFEKRRLRIMDGDGVPTVSSKVKLGASVAHTCLFVTKFLAVLNCSNVRQETIEAPHRLNAKRARKGKGPIHTYHILVLKSAARRIALGGSHAPPRIHLRRGHIKRRKTGNFWWEPCVVGHKDGLVTKDYNGAQLIEERAGG